MNKRIKKKQEVRALKDAQKRARAIAQKQEEELKAKQREAKVAAWTEQSEQVQNQLAQNAAKKAAVEARISYWNQRNLEQRNLILARKEAERKALEGAKQSALKLAEEEKEQVKSETGAVVGDFAIEIPAVEPDYEIMRKVGATVTNELNDQRSVKEKVTSWCARSRIGLKLAACFAGAVICLSSLSGCEYDFNKEQDDSKTAEPEIQVTEVQMPEEAKKDSLQDTKEESIPIEEDGIEYLAITPTDNVESLDNDGKSAEVKDDVDNKESAKKDDSKAATKSEAKKDNGSKSASSKSEAKKDSNIATQETNKDTAEANKLEGVTEENNKCDHEKTTRCITYDSNHDGTHIVYVQESCRDCHENNEHSYEADCNYVVISWDGTKEYRKCRECGDEIEAKHTYGKRVFDEKTMTSTYYCTNEGCEHFYTVSNIKDDNRDDDRSSGSQGDINQGGGNQGGGNQGGGNQGGGNQGGGNQGGGGQGGGNQGGGGQGGQVPTEGVDSDEEEPDLGDLGGGNNNNDDFGETRPTIGGSEGGTDGNPILNVPNEDKSKAPAVGDLQVPVESEEIKSDEEELVNIGTLDQITEAVIGSQMSQTAIDYTASMLQYNQLDGLNGDDLENGLGGFSRTRHK